jgi:hypothetical protein
VGLTGRATPAESRSFYEKAGGHAGFFRGKRNGERIESAHVAEAVQYRALDRAYFR